MAQKRENVWRKRLEDAIRQVWPSAEVLKMHVGVMDSAGKPDIYVSAPGLGGVWLELKHCQGYEEFDWSKQPTPLQKNSLRRLYYAGSRVGVIVFFEEDWRAVHGGELIGPLGAIRCDEKWTCESQMWTSRFAWGASDGLTRLVFGA